MINARFLIQLSLILAVTSLIPCKDFLKAESSPNDNVNENKKVIVSKDDTVEDENINKDASGQAPIIFFENPNFDFGKIFKGQKVEHIFKFENQGNKDLKISKVKSSCGCTAVILTNKIIPPGKAGEIKATFNSGSYKGKVTKSITVKSNAHRSPSYKLTISGEIEEVISARPQRINFGSVRLGGKMDKSFTVSSDSSFNIKKITPSRPFINASIAERNENSYTIITTLMPDHKIGRFSGAIYLETDNKDQPKVKIPFLGEITGDITTYPKKIYYGNIKKGKERVQKVFVKLNKENIEIIDVKVSPDYLSAKIIENYKKNKSQYLIEVKLHENAAIGKLKGLLEINTNSESQPNIKVPISGEIT